NDQRICRKLIAGQVLSELGEGHNALFLCGTVQNVGVKDCRIVPRDVIARLVNRGGINAGRQRFGVYLPCESCSVEPAKNIVICNRIAIRGGGSAAIVAIAAERMLAAARTQPEIVEQ